MYREDLGRVEGSVGRKIVVLCIEIALHPDTPTDWRFCSWYLGDEISNIQCCISNF